MIKKKKKKKKKDGAPIWKPNPIAVGLISINFDYENEPVMFEVTCTKRE